MMKVILLLTLLVILSIMASAIPATASTPYQMNRLGFLPGDGYSSAKRINNAGEVLGFSASFNGLPNGVISSFLWNHTSGMVDIQVKDQLDTLGDVNNNGQIAGTAYRGYGPTTAVLREANGELIQLDPITEGAYGTYAYALNNNGWIVGTSGNYAVIWQGNTVAQMIGGAPSSYSYAMDVNNNGSIAWVESLYDDGQWVGTHSYVWNQGNSTVLKVLNASDNCQAASINDSGTIVGNSGDHAVVWGSDGNIILDLGIGYAYGINRNGQIVGTSENRAVLWNSNGSIAADLGALAGMSNPSIAYSINDSGQIVGEAGYDEYQNVEAVLWQPIVPEPSSILTLVGGLLSIGGVMLKRRAKAFQP